MKKLLFISILGILLSTILSSCESNGSFSSEDILGRWKYEYRKINDGDKYYPYEEYWEFYENGQMIIRQCGVVSYRLHWEIVDSKLDIIYNKYDERYDRYDEYYLILKFTKNQLDLKYVDTDDDARYHFVKKGLIE
jgi:hypothetical protein